MQSPSKEQMVTEIIQSLESERSEVEQEVISLQIRLRDLETTIEALRVTDPADLPYDLSTYHEQLLNTGSPQ